MTASGGQKVRIKQQHVFSTATARDTTAPAPQTLKQHSHKHAGEWVCDIVRQHPDIKLLVELAALTPNAYGTRQP